METQPIGQAQMQDYCEALSKQLRKTAAQSGSGIVEMEVPTASEFMEMVTHSPSISHAQQTLMSGLKASGLIMSNHPSEDALIQAVLQAMPAVRFAAVLRKPGKPAKITAYIGG